MFERPGQKRDGGDSRVVSGLLLLGESFFTSRQLVKEYKERADGRSPFANGATFVAFEMAMRAMA